MDRLDAMSVLLAAVESGSLSKASRELRLPLAIFARLLRHLQAAGLRQSWPITRSPPVPTALYLRERVSPR